MRLQIPYICIREILYNNITKNDRIAIITKKLFIVDLFRINLFLPVTINNRVRQSEHDVLLQNYLISKIILSLRLSGG